MVRMKEKILKDSVDAMLEYLKRKYPYVDQAETYSSKNRIYVARIESQRVPLYLSDKKMKKKFGGWTTREYMRIPPFVHEMEEIVTVGASVDVAIKKQGGYATGSSSTTYLNPKNLKRVVDNAVKLAGRCQPDPMFVSFSKPVKIKSVALPNDPLVLGGGELVYEKLQELSEEACSMIKNPSIDLEGTIMAVREDMEIRNTNGIDVGETSTFSTAELTCELMEGHEPQSSCIGWASGRYLKQLDIKSAVTDALEVAEMKPTTGKIPEGEYKIILGQYAVADVTEELLTSSFALESVYFGYSWLPKDKKIAKRLPENLQELLVPRIGEKIAHEDFTLTDDPTLKYGLGSKGYDDEGIPTKKKVLVDRGMLASMFVSTYFGNLYDMPPTGNAFKFGAVPGRDAASQTHAYGTNMVIEGGDMSFDELKEGSDAAIYIDRMWYTYPMNYAEGTFSSSNRSTAFLIKNGEIIDVIKPNSFKIRGSVKDLISNIEGMTKERKVATAWAAITCTLAPAIRTGNIRVIEK